MAPTLDRLAAAWLRSRPCGGIGFLLELQKPSEAASRDATIFCAAMRGQPVAYLRAVPIYGSAGVYLEDYVYGEDAPDGTVEALFHEACNVLRERGAAYLTWGTSPLAGLDAGDSRDAPLVGRVLRTAFQRISWPYSFRSLHAFKSRFHPTRWAPKYLVFDRPFDLHLALALARAYAPRPDVSALLGRLLPGRSRPEADRTEPVASHA
jgi:phosphatidylglycerol lysyltransferase